MGNKKGAALMDARTFKCVALGLLLLVLAALVVGGWWLFSQPAASPTGRRPVIGFSMASDGGERWATDRECFVQRANELGASVLVDDAGVDSGLQVEQAERLIARGVDVLVVMAEDSVRAGVIVSRAHDAGIKVVAYDRLLLHDALDYYVSFDSVRIGEAQAQSILDVVPKGKFVYLGGCETDANTFLVKQGAFNVLQPRIDRGEIELVLDEFIDSWSQELTYANLRAFLSQGRRVDAVVAANDSIAIGAILALEEFGLAGKIPVSGQDASLASVRCVMEGRQTMTVHKSSRALASKGAEVAVALAKNEPVDTRTKVDNGSVLTPSCWLPFSVVTRETLIHQAAALFAGSSRGRP